MKILELQNIIRKLIQLSSENEWVEFKENNHAPEGIGKRISALSNGACLQGQPKGYLVFGIKYLLELEVIRKN